VTDEKLKTIKILVVDDDPFVIDMLAVILESSDYSIDTAVNGIEALQKYSADSDIGLIVSDCRRPEISCSDQIADQGIQNTLHEEKYLFCRQQCYEYGSAP